MTTTPLFCLLYIQIISRFLFSRQFKPQFDDTLEPHQPLHPLPHPLPHTMQTFSTETSNRPTCCWILTAMWRSATSVSVGLWLTLLGPHPFWPTTCTLRPVHAICIIQEDLIHYWNLWRSFQFIVHCLMFTYVLTVSVIHLKLSTLLCQCNTKHIPSIYIPSNSFLFFCLHLNSTSQCH